MFYLKASELEVLGQETWMRVKDSKGDIGFILADYVEPAESPVELGSSSESKDAVKIVTYTNEYMTGEKIRIDAGFVPSMDQLGELCKENNVKLHITSSLREPNKPVSNAIVESAKLSNHFVGHAIDMNIISGSDFYNSKRLDDFDTLPDNIQEFINKLETIGLKWGGTFEPLDSVHIDDRLNVKNAQVYGDKYRQLWMS